MTVGAAPADPELDLTREFLNDGAKFPLRCLWRRGRRHPHHEYLCACWRDTVDNVARRQIRPEVRDAKTAAGGEHRGAQRADFVAVARRSGKHQACRDIPACVQAEKRSKDVPDR